MGTVDRKCEDRKWSTDRPQHFNHRKKPMIRNTERSSLKDHRIPRIPIKKQYTRISYIKNRPVQFKKISDRVQKWKIDKQGKGMGPFQSHNASVWGLWPRLYLGGRVKSCGGVTFFVLGENLLLRFFSLEEALITCTGACPPLFMMSELNPISVFSL
jgi:hypothetical protein